MKTTQSSDELTKTQQNHIVFWSVFGNRRRSDWIRRRTNSPMLVSGFWASFCLNTDLTFGTRTRVYCLFAFPLSETVLIKLFGVVLNKFPPAGAQVPPSWILTYPEDHAEEEEEGLGRGDCAVHDERWVEENRGDWLPDRRMEGWKDGWMEVSRLSVRRTLWRRRAAVCSYSCLGHKFSEPDWLFAAVMITWSHACGWRWGLEGVSDGAGPSSFPLVIPCRSRGHCDL